MPERPAAPPRRASRKAAATAAGPSWMRRADRCSLDGLRDGRSWFGRTARRVCQCMQGLVAGRQLCRGEDLAGSGKFARPDLRAGLFPLALGEGVSIQTLCTRFAATGADLPRLIQ